MAMKNLKTINVPCPPIFSISISDQDQTKILNKEN